MDKSQTFDIAPLDRRFFAANPAAARTFLTTVTGTVLHEAGHYSAANAHELVPGHIVIARDGRQGAFIVDDDKFREIKAKQDLMGFIASSGALTELFFCDNTEYRRCMDDISFYNGFVAGEVSEERIFRDTVIEWKRKYAPLFSTITENIEGNYHRIGAVLVAETYLLDEYHVIPSSELAPLFGCSDEARAEEKALTASEEARSKALRRYVNGKAGESDRYSECRCFAAVVDKFKSLMLRARSPR